jgi:Ala-tRNA(Pro) deacylase
MLVLQAHQLVDFDKVKALLKVKSVRLAKEGELAGLFHDCEVGAMPPFGSLYKMPTYMDEGLVPQPAIVFSAGSHTESFKVKCADYMAIAKPKIATFAKAVGRA